MAEVESTTLPTPIPTPLNITALAKKFGVARSTIQRRLKKGWTPPTKVPRKRRKSATPDAPPNAAPDVTPMPHQPAPHEVPQTTVAEAESEILSSDANDLAWLRKVLLESHSRSEPRRPIAGRLAAITTAIALTSIAAFFSVSGMTEIFPGAPTAIVALALAMEMSKLVIAGFLAANWCEMRWSLRGVLVVLVVGLAVLNGAGVYGRLTEAHLGVTVAASSSVAERIGVLDAKISEQVRAVDSIDTQIGQIDAAIAKLTDRGSARAALVMADQQRKTRTELVASRQKAADALVDLRADRARLDGQRQRVEASTGPIRYIAMTAGMETEQAIRWLILLMVLTCDPAAIALTVAASIRR